MDYPLVSVIIPVFNMQNYLAETLDSVLNSGYPNFEVIIVDDGSTDNSVKIAQNYAEQSDRIKLAGQTNRGVSAARNHAIKLSCGKYILPVDGDDLISSDYIAEAVIVLEKIPQIKVVCCEVEKFGEKNRIKKYPPFSYRMLARKNMIVNSAMFRKSDWKKIDGGYCEEEIFCEDWDFWISMFKTGGEFLRLPFIGFKYRIRQGSRRIGVRNRKKKMIDMLNSRHKAFIYKQLGGKLHYSKTWSRLLNFFDRIAMSEKFVVAPEFIDMEEFIYHIPEQIKKQETNLIVEQFQKPAVFKRIIYGFFRKSKVRRKYESNTGTVRPIGYYEKRNWGLLSESCFIGKKY
jgi:glycosyltransferase involved in cell wall biosynthesis